MANLNKDSDFRKLLLPIGIDDYKDLIEGSYAYVDKTLLIKEFWESPKVTLVTRPRRFGKTISLSMLKYFFEKTEEPNSDLFEKTKIWEEEALRKEQGAYPVIFISFKDVKAENWGAAYEELKLVLAAEVERVLGKVKSKLPPHHLTTYESLVNKTASEVEFNNSLLFITQMINLIIKEENNTIILIDEYDSPITHAYVHKFYEPMVNFMRNLFSKALKGNIHLHKGFMTGVVRTDKDGILSGLNNPDICTMLNADFADKFGFTEIEVDSLLALVNRSHKKTEVKSWYNGYICGSKHLSQPNALQKTCSLYNPWSILKYLKGDADPETYWANTGSTSLLERLISESSQTTQDELKILLEGKALEKKTINQDVVLLDLDHKEVEPWSFLFFAGYITATGHSFTNDENYYTLALPNKEIRELYRKLVIEAISKKFSSVKLEGLLKALTEGNVQVVSVLLSDFVRSFCSSHDLPEKDLERSLHLFVLGLLVSLSDRYIITSNLESGYGRYDIMLCPRMPNPSNSKGVLLEFKKGKKKELKSLAKEALLQIKEKNYTSQLKNLGYLGETFCYGIASYKKELYLEMESHS